MPQVAPLVGSFNGGEISPLLAARPDVVRYNTGCALMSNWLPLAQGPVTRRPGFRHVGAVKNEDDRTWLARFVFSLTDAYILELGDQYLRFYAEGARILDEADDPLEIATPWTADDLVSDEGTLRLQFAGIGDRLFLVHPDFPPQLLERQSALSWTLGPVQIDDGPWGPFHNGGIKLQASAATGSVTLTASADLFVDGHVGTLVRIWMDTGSSTNTAWEVNKAKTAGAFVYSDGKNYEAQNNGTTGTLRPTHSIGTRSDGDVNWTYRHAGFGWGRITAVASATSATLAVIGRLPGQVVAAQTDKWQFGAWGDEQGYPNAVGFAYGRLIFARGPALWLSASDDFFNFNDYTTGARIADDAVTLELRDTVQIRWLQQVGTRCLIGTERDERQLVKLTESEPFGPTNADVVKVSSYGSRQVRPVEAHDANLFIQRQGTKVRAQAYQFQQDQVQATDLSIMAEHLLAESPAIGMAWQAHPFEVLWIPRADGLLVGMTWKPEQEVLAWSRLPVAGDGVVECVEVLPTPEGDQLWAIVRRGDRRHVEVLTSPWRPGDDPALACVADAALTYEGPATSVLTGLDHAEGWTVSILGDGALQPSRVVQSGQITLQAPVTKAVVGLAYPSLLRKRNLEAGAPPGSTAQGRRKRTIGLTVRLLDAGAVKVGPSRDNLVPLDRRTPATLLGTPEPAMQDDRRVPFWPGGFERIDEHWVVCDSLLPATLVALIPELIVEG